jgi:carbon storage regulator
MLVLNRKVGESIIIDDGITLVVLEVQGNRVRLGISAPPNVNIRRGELQATPQPRQANQKDTRLATGLSN